MLHTDKLSYTLKDKYPKWKAGQSVLLASGTGTGKTYFVFNNLLENAIAADKYLVYICNRKSIKSQIQEKYKEQIENSNHKVIVLTYQFCETCEQFPDVCIRPPIEADSNQEKEVAKINNVKKTIKISHNDVLYYVFDEAHYFISDALFNSNTNLWLSRSLKFENSISIFITATPEPLYCFFNEIYNHSMHECLKNAYYRIIENRNMRNEMLAPIDSKKRIYLSMAKDGDGKSRNITDKTIKLKKKTILPELNKRLANNPVFGMSINTINKCLDKAPDNLNFDYVHLQPNTYDRYNTFYFYDYNDLIKAIIDSNEKWLIFVDDERDGVELAARINGVFNCLNDFKKVKYQNYEDLANTAVFLSSTTSQKDDPCIQLTLKYLNNYNTVAPKVLIATSVLDCGVSIELEKCPELKNIVISQVDKTEFLQMLGRIRFDDKDDKINLYLKYTSRNRIIKIRSKLMNNLLFQSYFYMLNQLEPVFKKSAEGSDAMLQKYALNGMEVYRTIISILNDSASMLHHKDKADIRYRTNNSDYISEFKLSTTAYINSIYSLSLLNDSLSYSDDPTFYLKEQLSWIGKKYDKNCWYKLEDKQNDFKNFLLNTESKGWFSNRDKQFINDFLHYLYEYPADFVPPQLLKDKFRYKTGERKSVQIHKLNEALSNINLPFRIESRRFNTPERVTKWRVIKIDTE